jgi:hypothetical protein
MNPATSSKKSAASSSVGALPQQDDTAPSVVQVTAPSQHITPETKTGEGHGSLTPWIFGLLTLLGLSAAAVFLLRTQQPVINTSSAPLSFRSKEGISVEEDIE